MTDLTITGRASSSAGACWPTSPASCSVSSFPVWRRTCSPQAGRWRARPQLRPGPATPPERPPRPPARHPPKPTYRHRLESRYTGQRTGGRRSHRHPGRRRSPGVFEPYEAATCSTCSTPPGCRCSPARLPRWPVAAAVAIRGAAPPALLRGRLLNRRRAGGRRRLHRRRRRWRCRGGGGARRLAGTDAGRALRGRRGGGRHHRRLFRQAGRAVGYPPSRLGEPPPRGRGAGPGHQRPPRLDGRFVDAARALVAPQYPFVRVCDFGHWGDGGVHLNLIWQRRRRGGPPRTKAELQPLLYDLAVTRFRGSFSAEHGVAPQPGLLRPLHAGPRPGRLPRPEGAARPPPPLGTTRLG